MKLKILFFVVLCLFLATEIQADDEEFGFTGEFKQITLKEFPYGQLPEFPEKDFNIQKKTIRALMIGLTKLWEPEDSDFECFYYYSYHWPEYHEWWVGFIVVNYGDNEVSCTVTMQIKGPKKSVITRKATLQPNRADIFTAKVKLGDKVGLYTLIGKLTGGAKDIVKTKSYIYEIWDF
jgi:hypothetical protein